VELTIIIILVEVKVVRQGTDLMVMAVAVAEVLAVIQVMEGKVVDTTFLPQQVLEEAVAVAVL
jgi:hypothetical protein